MAFSKTRTALIGVAVLILGSAGAQAQTCAPISSSQFCVNRGVPVIDRYVHGQGGDVVCEAYSGAPDDLQYDKYITKWNHKFYACTSFRSCAWAQSNDSQAYTQFCQ